MAIVIALANQKGGVAKTTTCVNLGAGIALRNLKTLLIDFDPQANLSQFLGIRTQDQSVPYIGDWILDKSSFEDVRRKTNFENLEIIPSSETLKGYEMDMQKDLFKAFKYLQKKIDSVRPQYDFILIDTLPSFSLLFVNGISASDYVIVPAKLEYLSMQGLSLLQTKLNDVSENIKPVKSLGIVGTFFRNGVKESESCLYELKNFLPEETFATVINLNARLAASAAHSKPIQHFDRTCPGYADYENLVQEVLERCQTKKPAETR